MTRKTRKGNQHKIEFRTGLWEQIMDWNIGQPAEASNRRLLKNPRGDKSWIMILALTKDPGVHHETSNTDDESRKTISCSSSQP